MFPLQKLTLSVESLNSKGAGVARHDGRVYFIPWAIPGDRVFVQIEREYKKYVEARLLTIEEPSKDRVSPPCEYFFECGGCDLQHISYEAQIYWKKRMVIASLERIAHLSNPPVLDMEPSPKIWNYRSRIQLHAGRSGPIGFFKRGSHKIIDIQSCRIADDLLNKKLSDLKNEDRRLPPRFELRTDDHFFFSQVNSLQNEALVSYVRSLANVLKDDVILDLYSGSGNFALSLASSCHQVFAIERERGSIALAQQKQEELGITNITWLAGSVSQGLRKLLTHSFQTIVVNPPRSGMGTDLELLLSFRVPKIIYVSCDPAIFARDTVSLLKKGFKMFSCKPFDMFPHTSKIELVGYFIFSGQ